MTIINFLKETKDYVKLIGKSVTEIDWIGSMDGEFAVGWKDFKSLADFEYNNELVLNEDESYSIKAPVRNIPRDLVIVGDDWFIERGTIGNEESWIIKEIPKKRNGKPLKRIEGVNQELKSLNMEVCDNE